MVFKVHTAPLIVYDCITLSFYDSVFRFTGIDLVLDFSKEPYFQIIILWKL